MFSIIIPLYNKEKQVKKTLDTVLDQTYKDFEVIIVNDGSTDNSVQIVKDFCTSHDLPLIECNNEDIKTSTHQDLQDVKTSRHQDFKIRLINQSNSGVSAARNAGIENAQGEFVAFLDADDEWEPDYLQTQADLIKKYPEASVFATNYTFHKPTGKLVEPLVRGIKFKEKDGLLNNYFEVCSISDPPLWTSAIIVEKTALQTMDGFPLGVKSGEDLLTWAKLAANQKIAYSKTSKAIYCQGYSNPRPPEETDVVAKELVNLYHKYPQTPFIKRYLAFWYKMRMCRCLAHRMWYKGTEAFFKSISYNPLQSKIYLSIPKYIIKGK